jgi:hypothetical protein
MYHEVFGRPSIRGCTSSHSSLDKYFWISVFLPVHRAMVAPSAWSIQGTHHLNGPRNHAPGNSTIAVAATCLGWGGSVSMGGT